MKLGVCDPTRDFMLDSLTCNECKHKDDCPSREEDNHKHVYKMSQCPWQIKGEAFNDRIDFDKLLN